MIKIGSLLYASSKMCTICGTPIKVNTFAPLGTPISVHRPSSVSTAPKLSLAALIFEYLFASKIAVYEFNAGDSTYVEFKDCACIISDGVIRTSSEISNSRLATALVCHALGKSNANSELKTLFTQCVSQYKSAGFVTLSTLYQFCDSFYYGCIKNNDLIDIRNDLVDSSISAAFRSGGFDEHTLMHAHAKEYLNKSAYAQKTNSGKANKKDNNNFIKDCINGKYIIPYKWEEEQQKHIQPLCYLNDFVSCPAFESLVKKVNFRLNKVLNRLDAGILNWEAIEQDYINCLMVGKPGTGKTTVAYALSAATGIPVYTVSCSQNTDEDEFEGKTKIIDGNPAFVRTPFLNAYEFGGIVIYEELNLPNPAVLMGASGQGIEFPFVVMKNGYDIIRRHPMCVVLGTMNVGTAGSKLLSEAFGNRFKQTYILDDPTKESFIEILIKKSKQDKQVCTWVYNAYERIVDYLKSPTVNAEEIILSLSIRTCLGALENIEEGEDALTAIDNSIIGAIARVDLKIARDAQDEILNSLPNPSF